MPEQKHSPNLVELARWHVVCAIRLARQWDPAVGLPWMCRHCVAVPFDEDAKKVFDYVADEAYDLEHSGAIPLLELLELMQILDLPPPTGEHEYALMVPPGYMDWIEDVFGSIEFTSSDALRDVMRFSVLAFLSLAVAPADVETWEARLSSGADDVSHTYSVLSQAFSTGFALAAHRVPPWLPQDDTQMRLVRASWEGKNAFEQVQLQILRERGADTISTVAMTHENIALLDAEVRRRDLGDHFFELDQETQIELARVVFPEDKT